MMPYTFEELAKKFAVGFALMVFGFGFTWLTVGVFMSAKLIWEMAVAAIIGIPSILVVGAFALRGLWFCIEAMCGDGS
jgi:hypothetical protein